MRNLLRSPFLRFGAAVVITFILAAALVPGALHSFFSTGFFMPHRHCYLDNPSMLWLQGLSDFVIGLSYMAIAAGLAYLVRKARKDIPFEWMFLAFGLFIFSCGWTHFMEVWTLWYPTYWLSGAIKAVTAAASLATAVGLSPLLPRIFRLIDTAKASEQRRQDLEQAHRELQRAYKEMETFSYSLSHDIRGPLRAVRSFSSIVLEEHRQELDGDGAAMLEKVVASAARMDQLVSDVLALSRASRAELKMEPVEVEPLMRRVIQDQPALQTPKAQIRIEGPLLPVRADVASLTQCLTNLLGNAVKFVAPGVTPQVRLYTEAHHGRVRLWIADNGIGIPAESREKVFEIFQRLHSTQEYEGTGIGLAIVAKAVERMGGRVGVESEVGHGSRFWLELTAPAPTAAQATTLQQAA
jgi:signal transduction histidine kinase